MSDERAPVRRRRWIGWTIGGVALLLLLAVGWVVVRGIGAVTELQQVQRTTGELRSAIAAQDLTRAEHVGARITAHAATAQQLTSDPVWRAFEWIPGLGPNFQAVREVAAVADTVAGEALEPVLDAAADVDLAGFGFVDGRLDLAPFDRIRAPLAEALGALERAELQAARIDADATLPPLAEAVHEVEQAVTEVTGAVGALHGASVLLPSMLGQDEPRLYLIAMQNNAELRSSGGLVGSVALMRADNGEISLIRTEAASTFPKIKTPFEVGPAMTALFDEVAGLYLQNATNAPDFSEAGALIAQHWKAGFGQDVDGVIGVDAVVARHLVAASGPQSLGPFEVDADNVLDVLLSRIYAELPDPMAQDAAFSQVAGALFESAIHGSDTPAVLGALAQSAQERRIRIWSAHQEEQEVLERSTLGGAIPTDSELAAFAGVLLNDTTNGKMDFHAQASAVLSLGECLGEPTTRVSWTFANDAPADAAESLPVYVTGGGKHGVEAGNARTLIAIYGPEGSLPVRVDRDGAEEPVQTARLGERIAIQHTVDLAPGESTTITIDFTGGGAGQPRTTLLHTPMASDVDVRTEDIACGA